MENIWLFYQILLADICPCRCWLVWSKGPPNVYNRIIFFLDNRAGIRPWNSITFIIIPFREALEVISWQWLNFTWTPPLHFQLKNSWKISLDSFWTYPLSHCLLAYLYSNLLSVFTLLLKFAHESSCKDFNYQCTGSWKPR